MAVKLPPLCPSRQGSGARGCGVWAYCSFSSNYPPTPTEKDNFHGTFFRVFLVSFHWFGAASPAQLVLTFPALQSLAPSPQWPESHWKAAPPLWLNQPCSSSLSSRGSPVPQPQTPPLDSLCALQAPAGLRSSPVKDAHTPMVLLFLLSFYRNSRLGTHHPA